MVSDTPTGKRWHTREDSGLRLDREFQWWHDDERIEHPNIIEAFNQGLRAEADGRTTLHFGNDWCFVQIDDAAFRVNAVDVSGDGLSVRLSDRTAERLDASTLALDDDGVLSAQVKAGLAKARFSRAAQFQLAQHLELRDAVVGLLIEGRFVPTQLDPAVLA